MGRPPKLIVIDLRLNPSFFNTPDGNQVWKPLAIHRLACRLRSRIFCMNIHQLSIIYVVEEDRLLMRINGKDDSGELRAWLTRRLALALLPVLNHTTVEQMKKLSGPTTPAASLDEQRSQLLSAFQTEASLRTGDFETPYQEQNHAPGGLAAGTSPLLLTEAKLTLMGNGELRLQVFEKIPGQEAVRNFQLMMEAPLSHGLLQLLHQGLNAARWLDAPTPPAIPEPAASPADAAELLATDLAKPKYLN
jgi:hypothetical protein